MHRHGGANGRRDIEDEAHRFAASFLMPTGDVLAIVPRVRFLNQLLQYKQRWRVSVAALNYHLHKLKVISEWQYRTHCIEITRLGYRDQEPFGIERERSVVWQKVFDALRQEKVTKSNIAEALCVPTAEIDNLVFHLVNMFALDGEGANPGKSRASLRLIA
jgi:Zn-dependent peptidase ImmA (M78 family)